MDYSWNQDDPTRRKPLEDSVGALKQAFSINTMSIAVSTILSLMTNTDHFGNPIESAGDQYVASEDRYSNSTSKASIRMASVLAGIMGEKTPSPKQVDFFVKGMLGTFGNLALDAASAPLEGPGSQKRAGLEYAPVVGRLLIGPSEGGSRITDQFYTDVNRSQQLMKKAKSIAKEGDTWENIDVWGKGQFNPARDCFAL